MKHRIGLVSSRVPSFWGSCRIIAPNLVRAYHRAFGDDLPRFSYTSDMLRAESLGLDASIWKLASEIRRSGVRKLVFTDHSPHPWTLLRVLEREYGSEPIPEITFQVYGDFTLDARSWLRSAATLRRARVRFVCASDRQSRMVSRLLLKPERAVGVSPFPVDTRVFLSRGALRKSWRKRLGIAENEFCVIYTGRISLQKNITALTRAMGRFIRESSVPVRFLLAGFFDDLGGPFFGIRTPPGFYYHFWKESLEALPRSARQRIQYIGQMGASELAGLYNAADAYASLSLHHDEDYGMSPAESLCSGTPVVLSDWGGYPSFMDPSDPLACQIVPVSLVPRGYLFDGSAFLGALRQIRDQGSSTERRAALARRSQARLGIPAVATRLRELHSQPAPVFAGFQRKFRELAEHVSQDIAFPGCPTPNTFYEEIYAPYRNSRCD
jgi:glycosyltransferase involved in cell wall biosynthesis